MSGQRLRLFVALALPSQITQALVRWRDEALRGRHGLRLPAPEHLHVTLCFLGWQASDAAQDIAAACQAVVAAGTAPKLVLGRAVWLPSRRPRVLAVELDDPGGGLTQLQAALSARLEACGWYVPERRPYLGHVTVARVQRGESVRPWPLSSPAGPSFTASRVTVYRSVLSPAGVQYEALARVRLGRRPRSQAIS